MKEFPKEVKAVVSKDASGFVGVRIVKGCSYTAKRIESVRGQKSVVIVHKSDEVFWPVEYFETTQNDGRSGGAHP